MASDRGSDQVQATILDLSKAYDRSIGTWPTKREREAHTQHAGLRRRDIFCFRELVFFPFSSDV